MAERNVPAPIAPRCEHPEELWAWWRKLSPAEHKAARLMCQLRGTPERFSAAFKYFIQNFCWLPALADSEAIDISRRVVAGDDEDYVEPGVGLHQVILWPCQHRVIDKLALHKQCLILKTRQIALTFMAAWRTVLDCAALPNQNIVLISLEKGHRGRDLANRAHECWSRLPSEENDCPPLLPGKPDDDDNWSRDLRAWKHGQGRVNLGSSKYQLFGTTDYGAAGLGLTGAVFDEVALADEDNRINVKEAVKNGLQAALRVLRGWLMLISTGRQQGGYFHDQYQFLKKHEVTPPRGWADMGRIFVPVTENPTLAGDAYWRQREAEGDDPIWIRDNPRDDVEAFLADGNSIFAMRRVDEHIKAIETGETPRGRHVDFARLWHGETDNERSASFNAWVKRQRDSGKRIVPREATGQLPTSCDEDYCVLYVPPVRGARYHLSIDPSEGGAKADYTVIKVRRYGRVGEPGAGDECLVLHKRIDHDYEIARLAVAIAMFFNGALVTPETRGNSVLLEIHRLGYLNLRFASDESIAGVEKMNPRKAGFKTSRGETSNSRAKLISTLRNQIKLPPSEALARWYDRGTLQECGSFIQKVLAGGGVRIEAAAGKHDDLLMADGINLFVLLDEPYHFERMAHTQNTFLDDEMLEPGMEEEFSTANSGAVCNSRSARVKAKPRIEQVDIDEFIGRRS